jgi:hypothetical protein
MRHLRSSIPDAVSGNFSRGTHSPEIPSNFQQSRQGLRNCRTLENLCMFHLALSSWTFLTKSQPPLAAPPTHPPPHTQNTRPHQHKASYPGPPSDPIPPHPLNLFEKKRVTNLRFTTGKPAASCFSQPAPKQALCRSALRCGTSQEQSTKGVSKGDIQQRHQKTVPGGASSKRKQPSPEHDRPRARSPAQ